MVCSASHPAAAQCVASFREIKFPDGSARVKNYVCKSEGAAKPELRVEFNRLSEAAAGSLIQGAPYPDLERAFGKIAVVDNPVTAEAKKLFDNFGTKSVEQDCYAFQVAAAAGGQQYASGSDDSAACSEARTLWYLTFPDQAGLTTMQMPLPAEIEEYQTSAGWPRGFSFSYDANGECLNAPSLSCVAIWRPARPDDLANYDQNQIVYDRMAGMEPATPEEIAAQQNDPESWQYKRKRYFALIDYLTAGGWPDDFLYVTARPSPCGGGLDFSLHIRQLIMDAAFIQNLTDKPLSIDGMLGAAVNGAGLRKPETGVVSATDAIGSGIGVLQPSATVVVPLAISFTMASSLADELRDQASAEQVFNKIQALPAGTMLALEFAEEPSTKKARESFAAPSLPKPAIYAFGPELRLSGLVVNGQKIVFDQASRNFMQLTAGSGYGSCPYLYSWDDGHDAWVRHGKVIDAANSQEKEMTETKTFPGFRSKFRLAEEELEVSYIDQVKLEVMLKGGAGMTLAPNFAAMDAQDESYATIKAGDRIEFSFALPPTVKAADVKQSTLAITGYYRPYSSLLMARQ